MKNFEMFNRINNETQDTYTKDGVDIQQTITNCTTILVGRVKRVTTGETKSGKPMATLVLSGGAKQFQIQDDASIKEIDTELTEDGKIPEVYIQFYDSSKPRGNKAYSDLMKLATPKTEGKSAAVTRDRIVIVKASKQIKTNEDGTQYITYMGTRVYISGVAEIQENKDHVPGCYTLLGSVTLFEKDGEYLLSMPITMANPVTGAYDVTCYINCKPSSGVFTPEMIQSFGKKEKCARVALHVETENYNLDTTNPLKPTGEATFSSWAVIPEFVDGEIGTSNMGNVVTVE